MPEANQGDRAVLEHFLDSMWMERGLSWNTPQAYGNDLRGLSEWLAKRRQGAPDREPVRYPRIPFICSIMAPI